MNRRTFVARSMSAGLLAAASVGRTCAATAELNLPVIGLLDSAWNYRLGPDLRRGLEENGFVDGRHFTFEQSGWRGETQADRLAKYAADLVRRQVAMILAFSGKAALAAKTVTTSTPIIFLADDPLGAGLVDNLEQPGRNLTGVDCLVSGLTRKRIEIARQLLPAANLVALVTDPANAPAHEVEIREAKAAAGAFDLQLATIAWSGERSIDADIAALASGGSTLLVFGEGMPFASSRALLSFLAARERIPAVHAYRAAVEEGGLSSFGARLADGGYQMGLQAARVLRGDKPANLPVRQITRSDLVLNLSTARSLGIQISSAFLAHADEVID
jgi:putative ABC transport system substrate-binding protein